MFYEKVTELICSIIIAVIASQARSELQNQTISCGSRDKDICTITSRRRTFCTNDKGVKYSCSRGVFFEKHYYCHKSQEKNDFCDGGYEFHLILQSCDEKCKNRFEKIQFLCNANRHCSKVVYRHCTCGGQIAQWNRWSSYSACSKSCGGGVKKKVRYKCRDPVDSTISSDCGSKSFAQTVSWPCNTKSCSAAEATKAIIPRITPSGPPTTVTTTRPQLLASTISKRNGIPTCDSICDHALDDDIDTEKTYSNCFRCNSTKSVLLSCKKNPSCDNISLSACGIYRRWTSWSNWFPSSTLMEKRHRYQLCHHPFNVNINACDKEAILQTECRTIRRGRRIEPNGKPQWIIWLVIGIVAVLVLLCCFGITCYCFGKKQRRNRPIEQTFAPTVTGPDDVFVQTGRNQVSESVPTKKLGIMSRLERMSEHLYEAISGQGSRLLSRTSTRNGSRRSAKINSSLRNAKGQTNSEKIENEYTGNDENSRTRRETESRNIHSGQQSRVSVFITDPDGKEFFKEDNRKLNAQAAAPAFLSVSKASPIDYVEMNHDSHSDRKSYQRPSDSSSMQEKTRWERIPSPPSQESPKPSFFGASPNENGMTSSRMTVTTSIDEDANWPSAPLSAADSVSMWSESSFESGNYSDGDAEDERTLGRRSYQGSNSRINLLPQNIAFGASAVPASPGYLAPGNMSVVQYLSPRLGNPAKQKIKSPSDDGNSQEPEMLGKYLKMSQDSRATVKSWWKLGAAPLPDDAIGRDAVGSESSYCDANELNQRTAHDLKMKKLSREKSLDEKYTTSPFPKAVPDVFEAFSERTAVSPIDTEGYFNVNQPVATPRRFDPVTGKKRTT